MLLYNLNRIQSSKHLCCHLFRCHTLNMIERYWNPVHFINFENFYFFLVGGQVVIYYVEVIKRLDDVESVRKNILRLVPIIDLQL